VVTEQTSKDLELDDEDVLHALHKSIKKVAEDIEKLHFNTAISTLMELLNVLESKKSVSLSTAKAIALMLSPLAPHLSEELWEFLGGKGFAMDQSWPKFDPRHLVQSTLTIVVQVNGKVRGSIEVAADANESDIIAKAKADPNVQKFLGGKPPKKEIYVKGKLVSLVAA
jgi:leucyl-tRNA synthetase